MRDGPNKPAGNLSMGKHLLTPLQEREQSVTGRAGEGQGHYNVLPDRDGRHANSCAHGMVMQRHNHIRNFLAAYAKRCGATVHIEQRTGLQIRDDLRLASVRKAEMKWPIHTVDIHILNSDGHEVRVGVRVTAIPLGKLVGPVFREAEACRVRASSLPDMNVHDEARPFVLEQRGRSGDQASALGA